MFSISQPFCLKQKKSCSVWRAEMLLQLLFIYCHLRKRTSLDHLVLISSLNSYWSKIYIPQWLGKIQALLYSTYTVLGTIFSSILHILVPTSHMFLSNFLRILHEDWRVSVCCLIISDKIIIIYFLPHLRVVILKFDILNWETILTIFWWR